MVRCGAVRCGAVRCTRFVYTVDCIAIMWYGLDVMYAPDLGFRIAASVWGARQQGGVSEGVRKCFREACTCTVLGKVLFPTVTAVRSPSYPI